jgi:hypothetical protein
MLRLFGIILRLLMSISWNASSRIFAALIFQSFLRHIPDNYAGELGLLNFHTLQVGRNHFGDLFSITFFLGSKFSSSLIYNGGREVLSLNIRNCAQFSVAHKDFPSARCATAVNLVRSDIDIFTKQIGSHKQIFTLAASFVWLTVLLFSYLHMVLHPRCVFIN